MQELTHAFPDTHSLTGALTSALEGGTLAAGRIAITGRQANVQMSTFASEIVTCRLADGGELRLLCKYEGGHRHSSEGHRGRVPYEAEVYRRVLRPLGHSTPRFYGAHKDEATGDTWLFIEYVDGGVRTNQTSDQEAVMCAAARWIGNFHAAGERRLSSGGSLFLNEYDREYYLKWARRAAAFAGPMRLRHGWLDELCALYAECVDYLLVLPRTFIHGEYYPKNILFRDGVVHPVDWESAAVAAGEIDLASLTEGWDEETARLFAREYQRARWPAAGPPADFERRLDAARIYLIFRWLGDGPDCAAGDGAEAYYEQLKSAGERLGLI
jgi:hypothetical protein